MSRHTAQQFKAQFGQNHQRRVDLKDFDGYQLAPWRLSEVLVGKPTESCYY